LIGNFLPDEAGQYRHLHRESVGSTNSDLVEFAKQGDPGNLWLTAGEQLQGKGSRGRGWVSVTGNLYASLLLVEPSPTRSFHELTFVAAVAARNALHRASQATGVFQVKWPNDIMCNGKKCAGILLESGQVSKVPYVIIGMGINIGSFPKDTTHKATSLQNERIEIIPEEVFSILATEMASTIRQWSRGAGFHMILDAWREHSFGLGEAISIKLPKGEVQTGRFASIDDKGYMLLERDDGALAKISTADVFFTSCGDKG